MTHMMINTVPSFCHHSGKITDSPKIFQLIKYCMNVFYCIYVKEKNDNKVNSQWDSELPLTCRTMQGSCCCSGKLQKMYQAVALLCRPDMLEDWHGYIYLVDGWTESLVGTWGYFQMCKIPQRYNTLLFIQTVSHVPYLLYYWIAKILTDKLISVFTLS